MFGRARRLGRALSRVNLLVAVTVVALTLATGTSACNRYRWQAECHKKYAVFEKLVHRFGLLIREPRRAIHME